MSLGNFLLERKEKRKSYLFHLLEVKQAKLSIALKDTEEFLQLLKDDLDAVTVITLYKNLLAEDVSEQS